MRQDKGEPFLFTHEDDVDVLPTLQVKPHRPLYS